MKILLAMGHSANNYDSKTSDPGSIGADGQKEAYRNHQMAHNLASYLVGNYDVDVDVLPEKDIKGTRVIKNRKGYDYALSIHFNAIGGHNATGTECLYIRRLDSATKIVNVVSNALQIRNRGAKKDVRGLYMLNIGFDNLVEICFHDNPNDLASYNNHQTELISGLGKCIAEINGLSGRKAPVVSAYNLTRSLYYKLDSKKKIVIHGDDVKALQNILNKLGFTDAKGKRLVADGFFGSKTSEAVIKMQTKYKIGIDGIVGGQSARALKWTYKGA